MSEFLKIACVFITVGYLGYLINLGVNLWQILPVKEESHDVHFYITKDLTNDLN